MKILVPAFAVLVLATACGSSSPEQTGAANEPTAAPAATFDRCDELSRLTAPEDRYRPEPVYVANEMPIEALKAWARAKPGFEDAWIDREHNGWITLAFSADADERQAELDAEFPDVGVVAVSVDWTADELERLKQRVTDVLRATGWSFATGSRANVGVVSVDLDVLSEDRLAVLEPFADERICVDGTAPDDAVVDGPQPEGGDGWRLLADELAGAAYRTGIATDDAQYARVWSDAGLAAARPPVDFEAEVVIWFGAVYGSGCPIRMDNVVVDHERAVVHAEIVAPGNPVSCNADANAHAYVVAVERSRLPVGPFAIQLDEHDPPRGAPEERTLVAVDLSAPGVVAPAGALGPDPELLAESERPNVASTGGYTEPGDPFRYQFSISCGIGYLGVINGISWRTDRDTIPDEWSDLVESATGVIEVEALLFESPPRIEASANGRVVVYEPATQPGGVCP